LKSIISKYSLQQILECIRYCFSFQALWARAVSKAKLGQLVNLHVWYRGGKQTRPTAVLSQAVTLTYMLDAHPETTDILTPTPETCRGSAVWRDV